MPEKVVRFRINEDMVFNSSDCDFEYTAHINRKMTRVTWIDDSVEEEMPYPSDEVEQLFKNNIWVIIK